MGYSRMGTSKGGRPELARKGERQEVRQGGREEKSVQKDMVMAKKMMYEQSSKERLPDQNRLPWGTRVNWLKWVPILVSSNCHFTSLTSLMII